MRKKKQVTLQDIADELKLTIHTVSKALRGLPGMSEATREEVIETARRLGYRTKEQGLRGWYEKSPKLMTGRKRFTLLLNKDTPFFQLQLAGLQERLHEYGHSITVSFLPSFVKDRQGLDRWVEQTDLLYNDGLFIPPTIHPELEAMLLSLPLPKVLINYPPPLAEVDSVIWDVEHAIRLSVRHFAVNGHRKILYIGNTHEHRGFQLRWTAFQSAMRELGCIVDPGDHLTESKPFHSGWDEELYAKLLHTGCTAILCAIDMDLYPLLYLLQTRGHTVPADYSLIGLENLGQPDVYPSLARPALLVKEAGCRAAERMLRRIADPAEPFEHIRLAGGFIAGGSVSPLPRG